MRWFKHESDAHKSPKLEKVLIKYGADGYALYWMCLEAIAGPIDSHNLSFELKHDAEILAHRLKIDTLRVEEIMKYMVSIKLFEIDHATQAITCFKLAERIENSIVKNAELKKIKSMISGNIPDDPGKLGTDTELELDIEKKKTPVGKNPGHADAKLALDYLNEKSGRHFRPVDANMRLISSRLKEYDLDDLKKVIDMKCQQWLDDPKMHEYLRPSTLFNATNFASYQGQIGTEPGKQMPEPDDYTAWRKIGADMGIHPRGDENNAEYIRRVMDNREV